MGRTKYQRGPDTCRPVTVTGADGEQIHARVRGGKEMTAEEREAFGEIVRAASRRFAADRAANPPNPADYPLDVVLDGDLIHKAKPRTWQAGRIHTRVTTLCGINAQHVPGRDGGIRCPECAEHERRGDTRIANATGPGDA